MSELQAWPAIVNRSGSQPQILQWDSDDEVFLMGSPPPPSKSGGGGESRSKTENNALYEKYAAAVDGKRKSSWNEPGAETLYTGGAGGGGGSSARTDPPPDPSTRAELVRSAAATLVSDGELFKNYEEFPFELTTSSNLDSAISQACASVGTSYYRHRQPRGSIFDDLLFEIYQRWHETHRDSLDSDTFTEYSSATEFAHYKSDSCHEGVDRRIKKYSRSFLEAQGVDKLRSIHANLRYSINQMSARLVRQLKRRDHRVAKLNCNSDLLTAFLQASSLKRPVVLGSVSYNRQIYGVQTMTSYEQRWPTRPGHHVASAAGGVSLAYAAPHIRVAVPQVPSRQTIPVRASNRKELS